MQAEITQTIVNKLPLLIGEQQEKILEITESFINREAGSDAWSVMKKSIVDHQVDSGLGDLASEHDHYIYGTGKNGQ